MARKIKAYQVIFMCDFIHKKQHAEMHAYSPDNNWLCNCGRWTKDYPIQHKIIEQHPRVPRPEELVENKPIDYSTWPVRQWKVWYWDENDCQHIRYIDSTHEDDVREQLIRLNIEKYVVFNDKGKHVFSNKR